jgi:hypothetical protein
MLTDRWYRLNYHKVQSALWHDDKRFKSAHAGRRSGKTEIAKRKLVLDALRCPWYNGRFIASAPTHRQAVEIFWDDLVALTPKWAMRGKPSLSYRRIQLKTGTALEVIGLDRPERIEGSPVDGLVADEYGNMKPKTFELHIRPALSTPERPGWAWFIGVPEGRNHYYELIEAHKHLDHWGVYCWPTSDINPEDAEAARDDMDAKTYEQEYGGAFVSFQGLAYYAFGDWNVQMTEYNASLPLIICHDFNRIPGNAVICQEQNGITKVLDEVFLEQDSNSEKVGRIVGNRWKDHKKEVYLYGDSTGGAKTSQGVEGSDWDILEQVYDTYFNNPIACYPRKNPSVRVRLNSVNSRLRSVSGKVKVHLDPRCKMLRRDFEGVTCADDGSIEKCEAMLTHISDGFGYYIAEEFPVIDKPGVRCQDL